MTKPDQEFASLRRLLALKRHEQPPPRYFNQLPGRILSRIQAEAAPRQPWWERWMHALTFKPAVAYACGLVTCGLMIFGVSYSSRQPVAQPAGLPNPNPVIQTANEHLSASASALAQTNDPSSTNPMLHPEPPAGLFNKYQLEVQPAGHSTPKH